MISDREGMGMLDRYKKKGGFIQLLTLIETSGKQKQDQFLNLIQQENPVWEEALRKKSLTLERIFSWNPVYLGEILSRLQPLTLATVLHGLPQEKIDGTIGCLPMSDRRKIQQVIDESNPTPAEKNTCVMRVITETRGFILGGVIKLDKVDPELAIPENFEEQLNSQALTKALGEMSSGSSEHKTASDEPGDGTELKFDNRVEQHHGKEEVEFLKKKVNQLVAENNALKSELNQAKHKLEQIRKIA